MPARIKILPKEKCPGGLTEYFNQSDCHTHSFSECVFNYRAETRWDEKKNDEENRLGYIRKSLADIYTEAQKKNLKVVVVTEHPQFRRYNIPFERYIKVFNDVRARFIDDFAMLPFGFEMELKRNEKGVYIDDEIGFGKKTNIEMIGTADVLVFSMHAKHYVKSNEIKNSSDFLDALIDGINRAGELKKILLTDQFGDKVCILGHPWDAAFETNWRAWDREPGLKKEYPDFSAYEKSKDAQVKFFTPQQLTKLCEALTENEIYPELNTASIIDKQMKRGANVQRQGILPAYISFCEYHKIPSVISAGSDGHVIKKIGELKPDVVLSLFSNIDKAVIWCERIKF